MIDFINILFAALAAFILGMVIHSTWVHGRELCYDCTERSRCLLWCDSDHCDFYRKEGFKVKSKEFYYSIWYERLKNFGKRYLS